MAINAVLGFWLVAALLIVVPGPDWAFAISSGLRGQVLPGAAGIVLGYLVMTVVVAAGVGALVASSPVALTVLTVVGGVYLLWLGASAVVHPSAPPGTELASRAPATTGATVVRGLGVSGLNPKGLLVFVALLPQFTTPDAAWPVAGQMGLLGMVFTLTCAAVYLVVGSSARRVLGSRPGIARVVSRGSGVCMAVIGVVLLLEQLVL